MISPGPGHGHDLEAPWRLRAPGVSRGHPVRIERAPRSAACFVADQLEVSPDEIQSYARREQTRRQHFGPAGAFEQDVAVLGTIGARNRLLP